MKRNCHMTLRIFRLCDGPDLGQENDSGGQEVRNAVLHGHKVYDKVPRWMAARDGCKVMTTKWRDINKSDQRNPSFRAPAGRQGDQDGSLPPFQWSPCE